MISRALFHDRARRPPSWPRPARWLMGIGWLLAWSALAASGSPPPRLAVVISIDQCRADYLERFRPYFGAGGFRRLLEGGADYRNNHYRYAVTKTGPGHAMILSGVAANVHGVIANEWLDRATFVQGNCVEDAASPIVGLLARAGRSPGGVLEAKAGRSPKNFLASTVGGMLKAHYGAAAKVYGVSDKDRAAILLAGPHADGAFWIEEGRFVTSRYYTTDLPPWLVQFNADHSADHFFGRTWDRLLAPGVYDAVQGPDDGPGESAESGLAVTFPKRVDGGKPALSGAFYDAFEQTPWDNEMVAAMAERLVEEEGLGADETPDLLGIGFSQPDRVGHAYGPDSHEIMDSIIRLDRVMAELLQFLDAKVGLDHCVIVVTADHGVCPLPEHTLAMPGGGPAGRVSGGLLDAHVKQVLDAAFGPLPPSLHWAVRDGSGYHLYPAALKAKNLSAEQVADALRTALLGDPMIAAAYTRAQLTAAAPLDAIGEAERLSYYPPRSPDVMYVVKPNFIEKSGHGTTHGTPYEYDTHVPLVWYGVGVKPGVHEEPVHEDDLAPTLSGLLGVEPPSQGEGHRLF